MNTRNIVPALADRFVPSILNVYWRYIGGKKAYCLCFHDVSDSDKSFAITPSEFQSLIIPIKDLIVSIDDLKTTGREIPIVLTFDDGYESMISFVSPYLASENIPFVCYITTGFINKDGYLTETQLKELSDNNNCTIGSHMCSHNKTRLMTSEQVKEEWKASKDILQTIICKEVRHAALPYGSYLSCSEKSKQIALESGYDTIANTIAAPFSKTYKEINRYVYQKNSNRVECIVNELSQ